MNELLISAGTLPVNLLVSNYRKLRFVKSPIAVGSVPLKALEEKYRLKALEEKYRQVRLVKSPISVGIAPRKVLSDKYR